MNIRPIAVDLFAGAGGMSLGFEQAGFDVVAAVEVDPIHCAVHKFNFPECAVIPQSVVGLKASQIRLQSGIGDRDVDCVFGGPPCQGFSLIGQRVFDDPRNSLVLEFVRLVRELKAKTFVFENVKGLTVGKHKQFLNELVGRFEEVGYEVRLGWEVLNAAHYGVPQNRERLILMGARKGARVPSYPEIRNEVAPTVREALSDLPDADEFASLLKSDSVKTKKFGKPSNYAAELRCLTNDCWHFGYVREWEPSVLTSSARTGHTDISKRRFSETEPGAVEPISRFFKLPPDGQSNTLRAGTDGSRGAFTSPRPIHYKYNRCVTVREMARLHGFPDWFRFNGTKWHGARQVGNSVPPPLARAIGSSIMVSLGAEPISPQEVTPLGDASLLELELRQAAKHFGIDPPANRRDRKSGSRKRKQEEIESELLSRRSASA